MQKNKLKFSLIHSQEMKKTGDKKVNLKSEMFIIASCPCGLCLTFFLKQKKLTEKLDEAVHGNTNKFILFNEL